jgi:predicted  nucleic acid-binding Zn-ribbon protein
MPETEEHYLVCCSCGAEYHDYPDFAEPVKCLKCGGTKFTRMVRKTIPLKEWKRDLNESAKKLGKLPFRNSRTL